MSACSCASTAWRCVSVALLASIDLHSPKSDQVKRALPLVCSTDHSWYTFGNEDTAIVAFGRLAVKSFSAVSNSVVNAAVVVIVAALEVQTSFAPICTVTASGVLRGGALELAVEGGHLRAGHCVVVGGDRRRRTG